VNGSEQLKQIREKHFADKNWGKKKLPGRTLREATEQCPNRDKRLISAGSEVRGPIIKSRIESLSMGYGAIRSLGIGGGGTYGKEFHSTSE